MRLFGLNIIFVVPTQNMVNVFKKYFNEIQNIDVFRCDISQVADVDCIVCPSN